MRPSLYDLDRRLIQKFRPEFLHLHKLLQVGRTFAAEAPWPFGYPLSQS